MKIDKAIKAMPWPEPFVGNPKQNFRVTLSWPVVNHERMMVATFSPNQHKECRYKHREFKLVCSKKLPAAAVLFKGENTGKRKSLDDALQRNVHWCYPEISSKEETSLAKWLGKEPGQTQNHFMPELREWVSWAIAAEILRERDARGEIRTEDVVLCPKELPDGIIQYIRQRVLPEDKTLIYRKGNVRGICFFCGREVRARTQRFRQGEMVRCPNCGEIVTCYMNTSDRFRVDYIENIASIQKGTDGKTLFIRQWHIKRDHSCKWEDIPGQLEEICRYAIRGSRVAKWLHERKENWYMNSYRYQTKYWERVDNVSEVYDGTYYFYCPDNWQETLSGTSLQYCDLESYLCEADGGTRLNRNVIRFLIDWARYPMIEKFWKAGYTHVVHERVGCLRKETRNTVLWNRNTFRESTRFPTRLLKIHSPEDWTMADLQKVTELWEKVQDGAIREADLPELACSMATLDDIKDALGHASVHKILKYIADGVEKERQRRRKEKAEAEKRGQSYWMGRDFDTPHTYRDYLKDCVSLHLDLDDKAVLFPHDLNAAHARTISMVKHQADEIQRELFAKEARRLQWMAWEHDGLLIRPPADGAELIAEGEYLHHCVGGYADRMANGKTTILLIRRVEDPDTPFYTLELLDGKVQQCRTDHNGDYRQDKPVSDFVDAWVKNVANKRKKKKAATPAA